MKQVFIFCALIAGVKLGPVPDSDFKLLVDERYGGVPDHINGMALERDGDFNAVSHSYTCKQLQHLIINHVNSKCAESEGCL